MDAFTLQPGDIKVVLTGIAAKAPSGTYLRVAPRSGLTVKRHIHTLAGVIDPDYTGNIGVVLHNIGQQPQDFHRGDRIAQLIPEKLDMPEIKIVNKLGDTERGSSGYGSTEMKSNSKFQPNVPTAPSLPTPLPPVPDRPVAAAAAKVFLPHDVDPVIHKCEENLHFAFEMPYDITLSTCPYDNYTSRTVGSWGQDELLGLDVVIDEATGLPQLRDIRKSTPAARIKKWKSQLRNSYITSVNGTEVTTIDEIRDAIKPSFVDPDNPEVTIVFATSDKFAINPQMGLPQLYHDQMNIIGKHLWDIQNDAAWSERVNNAIPFLESVNRDTVVLTKEDRKSLINAGFPVRIHSVKTQRKLTRKILKQRQDWPDWQESEWKQLDQYRDQDMFGPLEPKP